MYSFRVKIKKRQWRIGVASALVSTLLLVGQIYAQDGGDGPSTPAVHPFAFALGSGDSAASETEVYDLRIPMYFTLIPLEDRPWGLRLKVTAFAGASLGFPIQHWAIRQMEIDGGSEGVAAARRRLLVLAAAVSIGLGLLLAVESVHNPEKAKQSYRNGLSVFPDHEPLRKALDAME